MIGGTDCQLARIACVLERAFPKTESTEPIVNPHIEITINKEEILRNLDEIQKKAEEVAKALETVPCYPPVNIPSCWIGDPQPCGTTTVTYTTLYGTA